MGQDSNPLLNVAGPIAKMRSSSSLPELSEHPDDLGIRHRIQRREALPLVRLRRASVVAYRERTGATAPIGGFSYRSR